MKNDGLKSARKMIRDIDEQEKRSERITFECILLRIYIFRVESVKVIFGRILVIIDIFN